MFMNAADSLRRNCVEGITANQSVCRRYVEYSIGVVTALNPLLGYEIATELAAEALKTGKGIVELVRKRRLLSEEEIRTVLDPKSMTGTPRAKAS
jgi:aspartate ammonia-lyase